MVDTQTGQVAFTVLMKEFKFPKPLMQDHFNENYVESEKYPKATFNGRLVDFSAGALVKAGPQPVLVEGDLTIHGVTQRVRVPGTLELQANRLLGSVDHAPGYSPMPKGGAQLSACDRAKLRKWVAAGAPNN